MSVESIPIWEWFWIWYSILSIAMHITLLGLILRSRLYSNRHSFFAGPFFSICIIQIWKTQNILIIVFIGYFLTSLPRILVFFWNPHLTFTTVVDPRTDIFGFYFETSIMDTIIEFILSNGTTLICFSCYYLIAVRTRKRFHDLTSRRRDLILLRCAISTFLMLLPAALRSTIHIYAMICDKRELLIYATREMSLVIEAMFVFQPWLLLLSCPQLRELLLNLLRSSATILPLALPVIGSTIETD